MKKFNSLEELRDALNNCKPEHPADFEQQFYIDYGYQLDSLPLFGGPEPDDTTGIFSWDNNNLLLSSDTGWQIISRDEN